MNIQDEAMKIHSQYGTSEMANYKLQLLAEQYAKEYHESEVKKLGISLVSQQRELLLSAICQFTKRNTQKEIQEVEKWIETDFRK